MVGMCDLDEGRDGDVVALPAEQATHRLVDVDDRSVGPPDRNAHGGMLEHQVKGFGGREEVWCVVHDAVIVPALRSEYQAPTARERPVRKPQASLRTFQISSAGQRRAQRACA